MDGREIFGPVLAIVPVDSVDEAIEYVNSRYVCDSLVIYGKHMAHCAGIMHS